MVLTEEQQAILDGKKGETLAKVMKTLVMYGEAFGAEKMVPVTSEYNHLVTSFGLKVMAPVYDLMQKLLDAGVRRRRNFRSIRGRSTRTCRPTFCKSWCSTNSCTPSRTFTRDSWSSSV